MINQQLLQPRVREAIFRAGWSEARNVAMPQVVSDCEQADVGASGHIVELLSNVYALRVTHEGRWIDFSPEKTMIMLGAEDVRRLERLVGENLYPLGTSSCAYLFSSQSGKVIFLDSDWLFFHSFPDVTSLCNGLLAGDSNAIVYSREIALDERPEDYR
jgi:hypothetical protein